MIHKTTIKTDRGPVHFEFEDNPDGGAVVALEATLDEFKGYPVIDNSGKPSVKFAARTEKDCTHIDGCIYMHLGYVDDHEMCRLIGMFLEALKDKNIWSHEVPELIQTPKLEV